MGNLLVYFTIDGEKIQGQSENISDKLKKSCECGLVWVKSIGELFTMQIFLWISNYQQSYPLSR